MTDDRRPSEGGRPSFERAIRTVRPRLTWIALVAILALGLALRMVFFFGLVKVDPFTYADGALSMARWEPVYDPDITGDVYYTQYIRLPIVVPAAFFYRIFGPGDVTSTIFPIAASLGAAVAGFWFLRRALGDLPALIGAALVALFPVAVINSTQFVPDVVQAAFILVTIVCLVAIFTFEGLTTRERCVLYFAAGACLALAFYTRGTAFAVVPPLGVIALVNWRRIGWEVGCAVAGSATVLVAFQLLLIGLGAEPFEDIRILYRLGNLGTATIAWDYADLLFTDLVYWPAVLFGAIGVIAWTSVSGLRDWRHNPAFALGLIVVAEYVYFEFFMSLKDVPTWWKEPRYLLPMVFPLLLLAGAGAGLILRAMANRSIVLASAAGGLGTVAALVVSIEAIDDEFDFYMRHPENQWDHQQRDVAAFLNRFPAAEVYTWDDDFARPLSFRMDGAGTLYSRLVTDSGRLHTRFERRGSSKVQPGSFVVILPGEDWWPLRTGAAEHWRLAWGGGTEPRVYEAIPPAEPEIRVRHAVDTVLGAARITSAGLTQEWIIPGQHIGIELRFDQPIPAGTEIPLLLRCKGLNGPVTTLVAREESTILRSDVLLRPHSAIRAPGDCMIRLRGTENLVPLRLPVVIAREAERIRDPDWETFLNPRFSRGSSLLGRVSSGPLRVGLPVLPAGDYWVELRLYDYGTGVGQVTATLNGASVEGHWGTADGAAGMTRLVLRLPAVPSGDDLILDFAPGSQGAVLLDAVAVTAVEPPAP